MRGPEPQPTTSRPEPPAEPKAAPVAQDAPEVKPAVLEPELEPVPEPELVSELDPVSVPDPESPVVAERDPEPAATGASDDQAPVSALTQALDSLGMAHHRPFSRS
jgi:hypothetical protein